jgi:DNA invertase Pin-like site-specific DNA recombinase
VILRVKNMRVGVYARVSTTDKGQDPELQLGPLREFAQARGWTIYQEYVDHGVSGATERRAALDDLLHAARRREVDVILVWKLDRFARSLRHLILTLGELEALGVAFVSLTESIDLTTPTGRLLVHVLGALGEFERDLIGERVRAGVARARAKGRQLGRPQKIFHRDQVEKLRAEGASFRQIAKQLGISPTLAHRLSQNEHGGPHQKALAIQDQVEGGGCQ